MKRLKGWLHVIAWRVLDWTGGIQDDGKPKRTATYCRDPESIAVGRVLARRVSNGRCGKLAPGEFGVVN